MAYEINQQDIMNVHQPSKSCKNSTASHAIYKTLRSQFSLAMQELHELIPNRKVIYGIYHVISFLNIMLEMHFIQIFINVNSKAFHLKYFLFIRPLNYLLYIKRALCKLYFNN